MTSPPITAGIEPLIFYLAIVVVWSILKKLSEKAQRGREEGGEAGDAPPRDMEDGLRDFIETVTGQKLPEPEPPPSPPAPPFFERRKQPIQRTPTPAPRPAPQKTRQQKQVPPTATPALAPTHYADIHTPGTVDITSSEISDFIHEDLQASLGKLSALTRMPSMRLAMPSLKLPRPSDQSRPRFRVSIKDHTNVRRAIVERVILGPPRAMGSDYDENQLSL